MAGHYFTVRPATGLDARQVRGDAYLLNPDGTPWDPDDPARLAQLVDGEGPLKEALNATFDRPRSCRVAIFGTSITDQNAYYDTGAANWTTPGAGWFWWTKAILKSAPLLAVEAGVSGNKTAQMLARITEVTALTPKPDYVVMDGFTNDILDGSLSFETITGTVTTMLNIFRDAGIYVLQGETIPSASYTTTAQKTLWQRLNRWVVEQERSRAGYSAVRWAGPLTDETTGAPISGVLRDGTHPNTTGAAVMGKVLADVMGRLITAPESLPYTNGDPTNGFANGLMLGDAAGLANGLTLTNVTGTVTPTKVARTDQPGDWQQITLTGGSVRVNAVATVASNTAFTTADTLVGQWEIDGDATNLTTLQLAIRAENGSGGLFKQALALFDSYTSPRRIPLSAAVVETYPLSGYNVASAQVNLQMILTGTGTIRLGRAAIRKV